MGYWMSDSDRLYFSGNSTWYTVEIRIIWHGKHCSRLEWRHWEFKREELFLDTFRQGNKKGQMHAAASVDGVLCSLHFSGVDCDQ